MDQENAPAAAPDPSAGSPTPTTPATADRAAPALTSEDLAHIDTHDDGELGADGDAPETEAPRPTLRAMATEKQIEVRETHAKADAEWRRKRLAQGSAG